MGHRRESAASSVGLASKAQAIFTFRSHLLNGLPRLALGLLVSVLLLALCSFRLCSRFSSSPADSYWIFIAAAMLQLGVIAGLTSSIRQLHPAGWIVAQLLICAIVLAFDGRIARADWFNQSFRGGAVSGSRQARS